MDIDEAIEEYNKLSKACNVAFPQTRNYKQIANWLEQLKDYQQLEEQGRLVKLPCKVGDTIYYINPNENTINKLVIYSFDIRPLQHFASDYMGTRLNFNKFGKTVFLTKSEAEAKLEELRGGENGSME